MPRASINPARTQAADRPSPRHGNAAEAFASIHPSSPQSALEIPVQTAASVFFFSRLLDAAMTRKRGCRASASPAKAARIFRYIRYIQGARAGASSSSWRSCQVTPAVKPRHGARANLCCLAQRSAARSRTRTRTQCGALLWPPGWMRARPICSPTLQVPAAIARFPVSLKNNMKPASASLSPPRAQTQLQNPQPVPVDCCSSDRHSRARPASSERRHGSCAQGMRPRSLRNVGPCSGLGRVRCDAVSLPSISPFFPFCYSTLTPLSGFL